MRRKKYGAVVGAVMLVLSSAGADTASTLQSTLEEFFSVYLLNKEHRTSQDKITVSGSDSKGHTAEIAYWYSLRSHDRNEGICNGYLWLLFGRGAYGKGAVQAFNQFPTLQQIELKLFDVETGTRLGKKPAEVLPTSKLIPYMKVGVERRSLLSKRIDPKDLKTQLKKGKCAEIGPRYVDSRWFDENYLKQAR